MLTFGGRLFKPGAGEQQADLRLIRVQTVIVGEHGAVGGAGAKILAGFFTWNF